MKIRYFCKNVKIDNRMGDYIQKRLSSLDKLLDKILNAVVEIDMDKKGKFRVEVMVRTPHDLYRAEETTRSIEGSIDIVSSELKVQIKKNKGKRETLIRRGRISIKKKETIDKTARN